MSRTLIEKAHAYVIEQEGDMVNLGEVLAEARVALLATQRMIDEALPKFDWSKSFLDANAIGLLNETPGTVARALARLGDLS